MVVVSTPATEESQVPRKLLRWIKRKCPELLRDIGRLANLEPFDIRNSGKSSHKSTKWHSLRTAIYQKIELVSQEGGTNTGCLVFLLERMLEFGPGEVNFIIPDEAVMEKGLGITFQGKRDQVDFAVFRCVLQLKEPFRLMEPCDNIFSIFAMERGELDSRCASASCCCVC